MAETPSHAPPLLQGLTIEAVEWLPSGADSGLVRVRARWTGAEAAAAGLPVLVLRAGGIEHRFDSLPDARFARDPASWRGSYLVPVGLMTSEHEALWIEWQGSVRSGLPRLSPGLASPPPAAPAEEPLPEGGQVIDRAVLAERRARRAEAAEQAQARVAAEALRAVEALELQSAELERRLAEATAERDALAASRPTGSPPPADPAHAAPPDRIAELEALANRRQAALAGALDSLARLRAQARDWRLRLRTSEIARAGDAVRLAVLEAERATGGQATRDALHHQTRRLEASRQLAEQRAAELAEADEAARRARAELEDITGALAAARASHAELERRLRGERAVHEEVRDALQERLGATAARLAAVEAAHAELIAAHESADARARELEGRLASAETRAEVAATLEARLRVESVARAALEDELDRDRAARERLAGDLESERAAHARLAGELADRTTERDAITAELADGRVEREALAAELAARAAERDAVAAELAGRTAERDELLPALESERAARLSFEAELEAERERRTAAEAALAAAPAELEAQLAVLRAELEAAAAARDRLRAELEAARAARQAAEREGDALQERIAELNARAAGLATDLRLEQAAREQAEAAAVAARRPEAESSRLVADLDAAASALRQAADAPVEVPDPPVEAVPAEPEPAGAAGPAEVAEAAAPAGPAELAPADQIDSPAATTEVAVPAAAPAPARPRPRIVSASEPPSRAHATGRSARQYPPLRGAIVKLAHDDPVTAGRLIVALLPAQAAALANPLDYDLTIREVGTFAVTVAGTWTHVKQLTGPRPRGAADFHLRADALTLAELLAGVDRRIGRFFGAARFSGSRRRLDVLRALPATRLSLAEVARAGAGLEPDLVYRALAYAIHPSWTRGEGFTIAQEIHGDPPRTWYLTVRGGGGLEASTTPLTDRPDATVAMTRETFELLLRGEPVPKGQRPTVRGDRRAVAKMKAWTDRAQQAPGTS